MLILTIIVIGMAAGLLAHLVVEGDRAVDWPRLFAAGITGSFVGGAIFSLVAGDGFAIRPSGIVGSLIGAIVVLGAIKLWSRPRVT